MNIKDIIGHTVTGETQERVADMVKRIFDYAKHGGDGQFTAGYGIGECTDGDDNHALEAIVVITLDGHISAFSASEARYAAGVLEAAIKSMPAHIRSEAVEAANENLLMTCKAMRECADKADAELANPAVLKSVLN